MTRNTLTSGQVNISIEQMKQKSDCAKFYQEGLKGIKHTFFYLKKQQLPPLTFPIHIL